jgi:hypothetical protein
MPTFDFMPLVWWGLPVMAAPLVIHLINLLRYRRVEWAAMEFLEASRKKYRTRAVLRQLLLLALRTAAIIGLVLALAQPRWGAAFIGFFGGGGQHLVLLDDSYSTGALSTDTGAVSGAESAFDRGRRVVERVAADLARAGGSDELSVGLFSRLAAGANPSGGPALLVERLPVGPPEVHLVRDQLSRIRPSWTAIGPPLPLAFAAALPADRQGPRTAWIVSDFRSRDWRPEETGAAVRTLADSGWAIRLVDCGVSPPAAGNLAITRLESVGGVPAVGVVMPIEVEIRNDGTTAARDVPLVLREDTADRAGLRISEIPAGGSVARRFDVRFQEPGGHVIEASLPADILPADDVASCVIEVVTAVDVLLVCDHPAESLRSGDALYVSAALAPGAGAPTGLRPRVEPSDALSALDLAPFDVVWLLDVERLDPPAIAALEAHARSGGGVVFFNGPRTNAGFVNAALYRAGEGLFPVPLAGPVDVLPDPGQERVPDVVVESHPVVAILSGQRNPLLDAVRIDRVLAIDRSFAEAEAAGLRRLLSLRTGGPLIVERSFGQGLVAAVLTTAAPEWNNWARGNPSWVVVMLELQTALARQRRRPTGLRIGDRFNVELSPSEDEPDVDFIVPPDGELVRDTARIDTAGRFEAGLVVNAPGVCTARWRRLDGTEQERIAAAKLDPAEGHLARFSRADLDRALPGVPFRYDPAEALQPAADAYAGVPFAKPVLLALLAVLFLEQLVAFRASYHRSLGPRRRA